MLYQYHIDCVVFHYIVSISLTFEPPLRRSRNDRPDVMQYVDNIDNTNVAEHKIMNDQEYAGRLYFNMC